MKFRIHYTERVIYTCDIEAADSDAALAAFWASCEDGSVNVYEADSSGPENIEVEEVS